MQHRCMGLQFRSFAHHIFEFPVGELLLLPPLLLLLLLLLLRRRSLIIQNVFYGFLTKKIRLQV